MHQACDVFWMMIQVTWLGRGDRKKKRQEPATTKLHSELNQVLSQATTTQQQNRARLYQSIPGFLAYIMHNLYRLDRGCNRWDCNEWFGEKQQGKHPSEAEKRLTVKYVLRSESDSNDRSWPTMVEDSDFLPGQSTFAQWLRDRDFLFFVYPINPPSHPSSIIFKTPLSLSDLLECHLTPPLSPAPTVSTQSGRDWTC